MGDITEKMSKIKHKLIILSGKGGVGKSTFTAHLAHGLSSDNDKQVSRGISILLPVLLKLILAYHSVRIPVFCSECLSHTEFRKPSFWFDCVISCQS